MAIGTQPARIESAPDDGGHPSDVRHDWTTEAVEALYHLPLPELMYRAQTVHRRHHDPLEIQRCTLLSIKTGDCPEDCGYCPQSAHYHTDMPRHPLLPREKVIAAAREAKESGSTRFCMGAAWRDVRSGKEFARVLEMVSAVASEGLETCVTLGMLTRDQAHRLRQAGLTAYNHNLDASPEFYPRIISTRTYEDRLETLAHVQAEGIRVCCGGIVGMGEAARDRASMLAQLGRLTPHPESLPINLLVRVEGTPLADAPDLDPLELVRSVATARLVCPRARVRLSAGRTAMSDETQTLCFVAGANSLFSGEKLLTTPNRDVDDDERLMQRLGMRFGS
jgi:biotin synthase